MSKVIYNPWKMDMAAGVLLLGVTIGAWLAVRPTLSRSADESRAQASLVRERRSTSELSRQLAMAQTDLRTVRRELERFNQPAWTDTDRSRRVEGLYLVARSNGIKVDGIEPGEPEMTSGRRGLPLKLNGRGTYAALAATLAGVREANPDMVVRLLDISPAPNSNDEVLVSADILWVWPLEGIGKGGSATVGVR